MLWGLYLGDALQLGATMGARDDRLEEGALSLGRHGHHQRMAGGLEQGRQIRMVELPKQGRSRHVVVNGVLRFKVGCQ